MMDLNSQQQPQHGTKRPPSEAEEVSESEEIVQTTKSKGIVNVQLFIRKAFAMITECDDAIASWTPEGDKFVVRDKEEFAATVIPQYYDHNNYSSFTRQLNFYGFTREQSMTIKVSDLTHSAGVGQETFCHQHFQRGRPDLLKNLQRRSSNSNGDGKNGKKRKKPKLLDDGALVVLQRRLDMMEQQQADMKSWMNQMRKEKYASDSTLRHLQTMNAAKDTKLAALEKRVSYLELKLGIAPQQQQPSIHQPHHTLPSSSRLHAFPTDIVSNTHTTTTSTGGEDPHEDHDGTTLMAATLAPHPRMKKQRFGSSGTHKELSWTGLEPTRIDAIPSREPSLDLGLLMSLTRDTSLLSYSAPPSATNKQSPQQDNDETFLVN